MITLVVLIALILILVVAIIIGGALLPIIIDVGLAVLIIIGFIKLLKFIFKKRGGS